MKRRVLIVRLCAGAATVSGASVAHGQSAPAQPTLAAADPATADDIVVTAQRRDERLARTPVAVAVVTADGLAKAQIVSEQDLRIATPGLSVRAALSSNQLNYALRGQSQDAFSNTRPGVLPYINDVQIGGSGGSTAFYDLQSVQVLKGPQGTLFGRSATGGAVLFTTAKPTDKLGGYLSVLGGNYANYKIEGALNVPLAGDQLMARVAGFYSDKHGFQYNLFTGKREGDMRKYGFRGSLTAKFGDRITNDLVVDYFNADGESVVGVIAGLLPLAAPGTPPYVPFQLLYAGTATPTAAATGIGTVQAFLPPAFAAFVPPFYNAYFSNPKVATSGIQALLDQQARGPYVISTDARNRYTADNTIVTNTTRFELGDDTVLKNIFGYTSLKSIVNADVDGTAFALSSNGPLNTPGGEFFNTVQVSDEAQLQGKILGGRLSYSTGLYFSDEHTTTVQNTEFFDILLGGVKQTDAYRVSNRTYAGYAQGTYALNDAGLAVTVGARYTSERVRIQILPGDAYSAAQSLLPTLYSNDQSKTFNKVSWQFGLQDQVNSNLLLYAVSRRAYKSGGFNGTIPPKIGSAALSGNAYGAEQLTDAELGTKFQGRVAGMPARLNVALFYDWLVDSQRTGLSLVLNPVSGAYSPTASTVNVPSGTVYGGEFDAQINPARWLSLGGTFNYTKSKFDNGAVNINGISQIYDRVTDTPKISASVFAEVTVPVSGNINAIVHADGYTQSSFFTSPRSLNFAGTTVPAYALANFRISIEDKQAGWSLTGNVKNAFNKLYYAGGLATGEIYQINTLVPAEPRTFTIEARYKF